MVDVADMSGDPASLRIALWALPLMAETPSRDRVRLAPPTGWVAEEIYFWIGRVVDIVAIHVNSGIRRRRIAPLRT